MRKPLKKEHLKEWRDYGMIILMCLVIHTQIVAQSHIPSGSMEPTIQVNDRLLINKLATKYRELKQGDIVVFTRDVGKILDEYWIKRVIGMPGDVVDLRNGKVYINDRVLEEDYTIGMSYPVSHEVIFPYTVEEGKYFLLGDNREGSIDSRVIGTVPGEDIVAIGAYRFYPFEDKGILE